MEEVLVVVLQGLVELGAELLVYAGLSVPWDREDGRYGCGVVFIFALLGGVTGAVANLFMPRLLLPWPEARVLALFLGPVVAGTLSFWVTKWRNAYGAKMSPWEHFWTAFVFVLLFDIVRFAYGKH